MKIGRAKYCLWRLIAVMCIVFAWVATLAPYASPVYTKLIPAPNISQNELLLEKLNLSNVTVLCPDPFIYSAGKQLCQVKCGTAFLGYDHYSKRCLYTIVGIINIVISVAAFIRIIKIRKELKFEHHPIFIGVIVNLIQSFVIGIPDIIGSDIFYCENKDIDFNFLNDNPPIQLQIVGALLSPLGISNRLWFIMAIALIFLSVSFPLKDFFGPRRNRIVVVVIEIAVCIVYPLISVLVAFIPFTGYELSDVGLLPGTPKRINRLIFGFTTHMLISGVTITLIILIIYKIHSKVQNGADETGKRQAMLPIEKRLMFFSLIYFILLILIGMVLIANFISINRIRYQRNDFFAMLTLQSPYMSNAINSTSMLNRTLTLLSPQDQLLVRDGMMPFDFQINGMIIRLMFVTVLPVLNFTCCKIDCRRKKEKQVVVEINKSVGNNI